MKALRWLDEHFEEAILVFLLVLIAVVELMQVIFRNVSFVAALTWPEEFCRFCWIWSVFLSVPYTIRKGNMLRVSVLLDIFPERVRGVINILVDFITAGFMLLLGINSISVVSRIISSGETSPAMRWPMWVVYSMMVAGMFLGFVRALQQAYLHIRHFSDHQLSTVEQTMEDAKKESDAGIKAEGLAAEATKKGDAR